MYTPIVSEKTETYNTFMLVTVIYLAAVKQNHVMQGRDSVAGDCPGRCVGVGGGEC